MASRSPLPPDVLSADGGGLYPLLNEASDFTVVIVALSYLDSCLTSLLAKYFRKSSLTDELLDANRGALGSLTSKTNVAYLLGLIEKPMLQDLQVMAHLRNVVAHTHQELNFDSEEVGSLCDQLKYVKGLVVAKTTQPVFSEEQYKSRRNRFILTAVMIWNHVLLSALGAKHVA
jgi:DNA-binding MltR family transcriptional regulator